MKDNKKDLILKIIQRIAEEQGIHPTAITKANFFKCLQDGEDVSDHDLKKLGGITGITGAHFPIEDQDLGTIQSQKKLKSYINRIEREKGQLLSFH